MAVATVDADVDSLSLAGDLFIRDKRNALRSHVKAAAIGSRWAGNVLPLVLLYKIPHNL